MKIIGFDEIAGLGIAPAECVSWVREVFALKPACALPPKSSIRPEPDIFFNTMPSAIPAEDVFGVKVVTRYPGRSPALRAEILLYRLSTGEALALLDGTWITAMRTGAVAALAAGLLAREGARTFSFLGLGNTARAALLCLLSRQGPPPGEILLLAHKGQEEGFMRCFSGFGNLRFRVFESASDMIRASDVVFSCVTAAGGLFAPDACYGKGVLVIPVHTRGFQNCDLFFDRVVVDDVGHVRGFTHFDAFKGKCVEMSDILGGGGRTSPGERILVYNIGVSLHDVYFAHRVYQRLAGKTARTACLSVPRERFWV